MVYNIGIWTVCNVVQFALWIRYTFWACIFSIPYRTLVRNYQGLVNPIQIYRSYRFYEISYTNRLSRSSSSLRGLAILSRRTLNQSKCLNCDLTSITQAVLPFDYSLLTDQHDWYSLHSVTRHGSFSGLQVSWNTWSQTLSPISKVFVHLES